MAIQLFSSAFYQSEHTFDYRDTTNCYNGNHVQSVYHHQGTTPSCAAIQLPLAIYFIFIFFQQTYLPTHCVLEGSTKKIVEGAIDMRERKQWGQGVSGYLRGTGARRFEIPYRSRIPDSEYEFRRRYVCTLHCIAVTRVYLLGVFCALYFFFFFSFSLLFFSF